MSFTIAAAQLNLITGDLPGNVRRIAAAARRAHADGACLLVTPQLALCGPDPQDLLLQPAFVRACETALHDLAQATSALQDLVLVVGSPNSSNSNRLRELAERVGTPAYLIDSAEQVQLAWLDGVTSIGVTAGASAPEVLVRGVVERLQALGASAPSELAGREETITFSMPPELRKNVITSDQ